MLQYFLYCLFILYFFQSSISFSSTDSEENKLKAFQTLSPVQVSGPSQKETPLVVASSLKNDSPPLKPSVLQEVVSRFGLNYFSYFYGPGFHPSARYYSPNHLGKPGNDGLNFQNQVSFTYKFSKTFAFDFQLRFNVNVNDHRSPTETQKRSFQAVRWETPRIGISGVLASGENWSLVGAVNTDIPYTFPLAGYQAKQRTSLFSPGLFARYQWKPKNTRWSIFSVVTPRYFFYADKEAAEPQLTQSGLNPYNKPELIIAFQPTLNYRIGEKTYITAGASIDYRKQVISNWNPLKASLVSNGNSPAWRFSALPLSLGVTFAISSQVTLYPFIATYPIAIQRLDVNTGQQATFMQSTSIGMWMYGAIF